MKNGLELDILNKFKQITLSSDYTISDLPPELLSIIFQHLAPVKKIRLVNKQWNNIARAELFLRQYQAQRIEIEFWLANEIAFLAKHGQNPKISTEFIKLKESLKQEDNEETFSKRNNHINLINLEIIRSKIKLISKTESIFRTLNCRSCFLTRFTNAAINELKIFQSLHEIDISNNFLQELPSNLKNCFNLIFLNVSNNNLRHLPEDIGLLRNLQTLNANSNNLVTIPTSLATAAKLNLLAINNNLICEIPEIFSKKTLGGTIREVLSSQKQSIVENGPPVSGIQMRF